MKLVLHFLKFIGLLSLAANAYSDVIVRFEIQQNTIVDNVFLKLYDDSPLTVSNFLNYVNDGDYDMSFVHRSVPGFVVQGGGFTFDPNLNDGSFTNDPLLNDYPGGLQEVPTDPPVNNEFDRSNLRGTLAMAKLGDDPDSATSQWFVNLDDNSGILDDQNGGFTVFGEVLSNGMDVFDAIALQPIYDKSDEIHTAFNEIPLIDYVSGEIFNNNLVLVNRAEEKFSITPDIDFGLIMTGDNQQSTVTIQNSGTNDLSIGGIADLDSLMTPFEITSTDCQNIILLVGEMCEIVISYTPLVNGPHVDDFNIEFPVMGLSYTFHVDGVGLPTGTQFTITPEIDYGTVTIGSNLQPEVIIRNIGSDDLVIGGIADQDTASDPFNVFGFYCIDKTLSQGEECAFAVNFRPLSDGTYADDFNIELPDIGASYTVLLQGIGLTAPAEPDFSIVSSSIGFVTSDFGEVDVLFAEDDRKHIVSKIIQNSGDLPLDITSITSTGTNASEFTTSGDCVGIVGLDPGGICFLDIIFKPLTTGNKTANIVINSNDPDENPFLMPMFADVIPESDGVPPDIEDAAPNNGDGNNDNILDSRQSNVVSIMDANEDYVTFVSDDIIQFDNFQLNDENVYGVPPTGVDLESGVFDFVINDLNPGSSVSIGLILPANIMPGNFYAYGLDDGSNTQLWYDFEYDGSTGATILGIATTTSPVTNISLQRNFVVLTIKDGGRGDKDDIENGEISVALGYTKIPVSEGGSGSIGIYQLFLILSLVILCRVVRIKQ